MTVKHGGKEWTEAELEALSAAELTKMMNDIDAQRLELLAQNKTIKVIVASKLKAEALIARLGGLKEADVEALHALLSAKPDEVKAVIAMARTAREEIRVTANQATIGVTGSGA